MNQYLCGLTPTMGTRLVKQFSSFSWLQMREVAIHIVLPDGLTPVAFSFFFSQHDRLHLYIYICSSYVLVFP
jgi:hypothetical protein